MHKDNSSVSHAKWKSGPVPITVVLITLNEAHNLEKIFRCLSGWAQDVIVVDSYSKDGTVDICLQSNVKVVQRKFDGFGSQWNFAISNTGIQTPWTMKLDPDEYLSDTLKTSIARGIDKSNFDGFLVRRQLYFLGGELPIYQKLVRVWKTGVCRFTDLPVNEHPIISGTIGSLEGVLEHHDSLNLHQWFEKQNRYTTAEANNQASAWRLAAKPLLFGSKLERVSWVKKNFWRFPFRYQILFVYNFVCLGAYKAGKRGFIWSKLRSFVYWQWELKHYEISVTGRYIEPKVSGVGSPDPRVEQF